MIVESFGESVLRSQQEPHVPWRDLASATSVHLGPAASASPGRWPLKMDETREVGTDMKAQIDVLTRSPSDCNGENR